MEELLDTKVLVTGLVVIFLSGAINRFGKLVLEKSTLVCRRTRSRIQGWKWERHKRRIEKRLDKVQALARAESGFKAMHPWLWSEELNRSWVDAFEQLLAKEVSWDVKYPEHNAVVRVRNRKMYVSWGEFKVAGGLDMPQGTIGYSGNPDNQHWDVERIFGDSIVGDDS